MRDYGDAGIVVSVMDHKAFGKAIVKLSVNASLRKKMGDIAYKRVCKYYQRNMFIEDYRGLYRKIGGR